MSHGPPPRHWQPASSSSRGYRNLANVSDSPPRTRQPPMDATRRAQSPEQHRGQYYDSRRPPRQVQLPNDHLDVARGRIGSTYGPYAQHGRPGGSSATIMQANANAARAHQPAQAWRGRDMTTGAAQSPQSSPEMGRTRYTPRRDNTVRSPFLPFAPAMKSQHSQDSQASRLTEKTGLVFSNVYTKEDEIWDERLHDPMYKESVLEKLHWWHPLSLRGWLNAIALALIAVGLIGFFMAYPVTQYALAARNKQNGMFKGGEKSTVPPLVDSSTPDEALTRVGFDGAKYNLVFSDEFETPGRTFWPGDDPYWEAVDLHYWATGDYEWYDPDAITTKDGKLVITVTEEPTNGFGFRSGMLQSWNKFCFTGGYIEVSVSLPGSSSVAGFWPGAWTMGNLGRAGYGATTDGTWPYSYDSCDIGVLPNQTSNGSPVAATTGGGYGGYLSYQPGQRLSACTCGGEEHPGPSVKTGRAAPEIDILEAQISYIQATGQNVGTVSQSAQVAPYNAGYQFNHTAPTTTVYDSSVTYLNEYLGGVYQQALSAVTTTDQTAYDLSGGNFATYGFEAWPDREDGYITWSANGKPTWQITSDSIGPDPQTQISQRLISEEPMYIILNLGLSDSFQNIDWKNLQFPAQYQVDYVRVYQKEGQKNIGCSPSKMPTAAYIDEHINAYTNPNLTTWELAGYSYPRNSMLDNCK